MLTIRKLLFIFICLTISQTALSEPMNEGIQTLQKQWAHIKYQLDDSLKAEAYQQLISESDALVQDYPGDAEPLVWSAIIYSSYAGAVGGIKSITKALPAVKKSRALLEQAEQIDATALDGSVMTSLGALYYQVPGWPVGFGNKKKARNYLEKAVQMSENGLDANYFYGDFLVGRKEYSKAVEVLEKALDAPTLENRPIADQGRRQEIEDLLQIARDKT